MPSGLVVSKLISKFLLPPFSKYSALIAALESIPTLASFTEDEIYTG